MLCLNISVAISRWTIKRSRYELQDSVEMKSSQLRHIYKRAIILLRTLYSFVRMMPAYQVQQATKWIEIMWMNYEAFNYYSSLKQIDHLYGEGGPFQIANVTKPGRLHIYFGISTNFSWTLLVYPKGFGWMDEFRFFLHRFTGAFRRHTTAEIGLRWTHETI